MHAEGEREVDGGLQDLEGADGVGAGVQTQRVEQHGPHGKAVLRLVLVEEAALDGVLVRLAAHAGDEGRPQIAHGEADVQQVVGGEELLEAGQRRQEGMRGLVVGEEGGQVGEGAGEGFGDVGRDRRRRVPVAVARRRQL